MFIASYTSSNQKILLASTQPDITNKLNIFVLPQVTLHYSKQFFQKHLFEAIDSNDLPATLDITQEKQVKSVALIFCN